MKFAKHGRIFFGFFFNCAYEGNLKKIAKAIKILNLQYLKKTKTL